jgi:hypothetical protein
MFKPSNQYQPLFLAFITLLYLLSHLSTNDEIIAKFLKSKCTTLQVKSSTQGQMNVEGNKNIEQNRTLKM